MQATNTPYKWEKFSGKVPANAVRAGDTYVVIRAHHSNDWVAGKLNSKDLKAYVPFDSKEVEVSSEIEVLVPEDGASVSWVASSDGQVPQGAVGPFGNDNIYVGRIVCPEPEKAHTPGKIHPNEKSIYIPFDGKEIKQSNYEVLVIKSSGTAWVKFSGSLPSNAVLASDQYAVIRAKHNGDWIPGKFSRKENKGYIPHDSKEVEVNSSDIEVLIHGPGAEPKWVSAINGNVPAGAVGPFGPDGLYIGRAVCPAPENVNTPGKIHPSEKCLYIPFDGKEHSVKEYEALVI